MIHKAKLSVCFDIKINVCGDTSSETICVFYDKIYVVCDDTLRQKIGEICV